MGHTQELQTPEAVLILAESILLGSGGGGGRFELSDRQRAIAKSAVENYQIWLIAVSHEPYCHSPAPPLIPMADPYCS